MAIHSPRKLAYEDFAKIPEDGRRHEILDGAHVVSPAPTPQHQGLLSDLHLRVGSFVEAHSLGRVFFAPLDVLLSPHDIVEPDLLFVAQDRLEEIIGPLYLDGAPDLVVEVLSPSTRRRDLGKKRARYEKLGVREVWTFDLNNATTQVLRREGDRFLPPVVLSAEAGDVLTTPLLPGLEISLRRLFRR